MNDILRISIPVTIWIASFSAIYGLEGVVCSDHWSAAGLSHDLGRIALILSWAIAIALQAVLLCLLHGPRFRSLQPWMHVLSLTLGCVALVATVWSLMPVLTTSLCL